MIEASRARIRAIPTGKRSITERSPRAVRELGRPVQGPPHCGPPRAGGGSSATVGVWDCGGAKPASSLQSLPRLSGRQPPVIPTGEQLRRPQVSAAALQPLSRRRFSRLSPNPMRSSLPWPPGSSWSCTGWHTSTSTLCSQGRYAGHPRKRGGERRRAGHRLGRSDGGVFSVLPLGLSSYWSAEVSRASPSSVVLVTGSCSHFSDVSLVLAPGSHVPPRASAPPRNASAP